MWHLLQIVSKFPPGYQEKHRSFTRWRETRGYKNQHRLGKGRSETSSFGARRGIPLCESKRETR